MRHFKTEGLILKKQPFGERDYLLTILTPWKGKIEVIAKGVTNIRSRRLGTLEIPNLALFEIYDNQKNKFLSQCELENSFADLKKSLNLIGQINYLVELTNKFTPLEKKSPLIFNLLKNTLFLLKKTQKTALILEHFKIKLLDLSGLAPDLKTCSACGRKIKQGAAYLCKNHFQLYCPDCRQENLNSMTLPFNNLKLFSFLKQHLSHPTIPKIKTGSEDLNTLNQLTSLLINHHLSYELNSVHFLTSLKDF